MKRIVIIPVLLLSIIWNSILPALAKPKLAPKNNKKEVVSKLPQKGKASYYSDKYTGRLTANAERYHPNQLTAAHPSLPLGMLVKVTNLKNQKTAIVKINDRCKCTKLGRIIDLSKSAAIQLDMLAQGITSVKIERVASLN
jgi:rare lipoprotein A